VAEELLKGKTGKLSRRNEFSVIEAFRHVVQQCFEFNVPEAV
jgi:hypothetical protein